MWLEWVTLGGVIVVVHIAMSSDNGVGGVFGGWVMSIDGLGYGWVR